MKLSNRIHINELPAEIDSIFDHLLGGHRNVTRRGFNPRTNVVEQEKEYVVSIELPGVACDDVSVEVADGRLSISGEKKSETVEENATSHRVERIEGEFERVFEFPTQVDFEKIEASSTNGVLTIRLPKSEQVLPRKVEINVTK